MKRFFISSVLIATLTIASVFSTDLNSNYAAKGTTAYTTTATANAAVVNPIKSSTPTVKATVRTATTTTLKTGNVSQASGYYVYRAASYNGTYKYIGKTTNGSYTDTGLSSAKSYYYKAKAYKVISGKKYYSKTSAAAGVTPTLSKPSYIAAQSSTSGTASVAWTTIKGAGKVYVYRSTSADGTYKYVGSSTCTSYTDNSVTAGKTYYYKVRGVKSSNGVQYYGVFSAKASVKVKTSSSSAATPTPAPTSTPTPTPTSGGSNGDTNTGDSSFASQVLKIVNEERAKAGVSALTISSELVAPANKRAKEIKESFSHTRPDGTAWSTVLTEYNVSVGAAGENIAYGYNTPEAVMTAWMNSEGHRANILSKNYKHIGIGVYEVNGTVYCEQLFSD